MSWFWALSLIACNAQHGAAPDVLLVSIDTLRADHLGAYGDTRGLTPNLDRFAAESVLFERAWTQANFTLAAHAAVFNGQYPSALGPVRGDTVYPPSRTSLPALLGLYGYDTGGFTGGGMLGDCYGIQEGFSTWDSPGCTEYGGFFRSAPAAMKWIGEREDKPWFAFVHGYDPHQPYLKPAPYGLAWADPSRPPAVPWAQLLRVHAIFDGHLTRKEAMPAIQGRLRPWDAGSRAATAAWFARETSDAFTLTDADHESLKATYAGGVAYADAWFGWMLEELRRTGRLDHTVVIVMSDHGEMLGEDGRYGHSHTLQAQVGHVPLMIRLPGEVGRGVRVSQDVALFDLFPTILALTGSTAPTGLPARSLLPLMRGEAWTPADVLYAEGKEATMSARSGDDLLVFGGIEPGSPFLSTMIAAAPLDGPAFAASPTADLGRREALRAKLLGVEAAIQPPTPAGAVNDPAVLDAMRKHGYFDTP